MTRSKVHGVVAILFALAWQTASAQAPKPPAPAPSAQRSRAVESTLWGRWRATAMEGGPQQFDSSAVGKVRVVLAEKKLAIHVGRQVVAEGVCTLDPKQKPAAIDLQLKDGRLLGVYQLVEGELTICLSDAARGRPKRCAVAGDGAGELLLVLRRDFGDSPLFLIAADGTNLRRLTGVDDFDACGSPDWSNDGRLAFDAWRAWQGESYGDAHIFTIRGNGADVRDLGPGAMPSWSPDGKQLAFSRYQPRGVYRMNVDGSDRRVIDTDGWGVEWSPTSNEVAYTVHDGNANLCVQDLKDSSRRTLLTTPFRQIYWGFCWSGDGQWLCFKGITAGGSDILAAVHRTGEANGYKVVLMKTAKVRYFFEGLSWRGRGQPILDAMIVAPGGHCQLYRVDPDGKAPPQLLAGQDPLRSNEGSAWSRDGKRIAFSSREVPRPPTKAKPQATQ